MSQRNLSLTQFLDLVESEVNRGIIDGKDFMKAVKESGIPRMISDVRGALRLAVEREGDGFSVTTHQTAVANESINNIGNSQPANDNGMREAA